MHNLTFKQKLIKFIKNYKLVQFDTEPKSYGIRRGRFVPSFIDRGESLENPHTAKWWYIDHTNQHFTKLSEAETVYLKLLSTLSYKSYKVLT